MYLANELFIIPRKGDTFILYIPLNGVLMNVNGGAIGLLKKIRSGGKVLDSELACFEQLKTAGVIVDKKESAKTKKPRVYAPTSVTLMPTFKCNLRCTYCYAWGGEDASYDLTHEASKSAIDFVVGNAKKSQNRRVHLGFHGGGEPLYPEVMPLVRNAVSYFRLASRVNGLKESLSVTTNGTLDKKSLDWVIENFSHINVSIDGPEDIQNRQRPMFNGGGSYYPVTRTVRQLEKSNCDYNLRTTITSESVSRMAEIVEFLHSISPSVKTLHMEPLFECGRCRTSAEKAPSKQDFLDNFLIAAKKAKELGKSLHYSGSALGILRERFCGAAGTNFFVSPQGFVTTCPEVSRLEDDGAEVFIIGKYVPEIKKFEFYRDRIKNLRKRTIFKLPHCKDCFAKFNCAGDCLAKCYSLSGDLSNTEGSLRCEINQGILLSEITERLW